jgi:predicted MFS family arabinose efflux permease
MKHRRADTLLAFASFGLLWGAWAAIVPAVQDGVGASKAGLGLALLGVGLGSLPAMLLVGPQVNRRGPRVMPLALAALAGAALLPGVAESVPALLVALVAVGAASGAVDVAINAAAAEYEATTGHRIMQLAHALFSVGVLVGAVGAGLAREFLDAGRLEVLAGVSGVLLAAAFVNRRQPGREGAVAAPGAERMRFRRYAIVLGLVCGASFLIEGGIEAWSALFLERELDASPAVGALGPSAYALAMVLGRLSGQWLTDRVPDRVLLASGALVSLGGLLLAAAAGSIPVAVVAFFLGGAGVSVAAPVAFSAAGRRAGEAERGSAVATVTTIGYVGFLAGPPLTGAAAEAVGLRASFVVLACFAAALAVAAPRLALDGRGAAEPAAA